MEQLRLDYEGGLSVRYRSLRELLSARIHERGVVAVAGMLDKAPSHLCESLARAPVKAGDRKFDIGELEAYLDKYRDIEPILYLVEKYIGGQDARRDRAVSELTKLAERLPELLATAGLDTRARRSRGPPR